MSTLLEIDLAKVEGTIEDAIAEAEETGVEFGGSGKSPKENWKNVCEAAGVSWDEDSKACVVVIRTVSHFVGHAKMVDQIPSMTRVSRDTKDSFREIVSGLQAVTRGLESLPDDGERWLIQKIFRIGKSREVLQQFIGPIVPHPEEIRFFRIEPGYAPISRCSFWCKNSICS